MDDAELRQRLWGGFAALQTLLGGSARNGWVLRREGLVASAVPSAPDSPALNAAVALNPEAAPPAPRPPPRRPARGRPAGGAGRGGRGGADGPCRPPPHHQPAASPGA